MSGPIEVRLHGSRLDQEEAEPLDLSADINWRVVAPAWQTVWWDKELATSPYSTELIGPAMGPLWDDHPFADLSDALYRIAYGRSLEAWVVLFHADSGERYQMTAEVFRIDSGRASSTGAWGTLMSLRR